MLTGERSHIRDYWKSQGDKALECGIKGVIIMVGRATYSQLLRRVFMTVLPLGRTLECLRTENPRCNESQCDARTYWTGQKVRVGSL